MKEAFNTAVHYVYGAWSGWHSVERDEIPATALRVGMFFGYQVVGVWTKGDRGYPELRQFTVGFTIGHITRRIWEWLTPREPA